MRCIAFIVFSLLCLPASARSVEFEGKQVREYTKEWTDGYYNKYKAVYHGYLDNSEFETWHGPATRYFNGRKSVVGTYRDGKRVGVFTFWAINGVKTSEINYVDGLPHGKVLEWDWSGKKLREQKFERGEIKENLQWNTKGKLIAEGSYKDRKEWEGTFVRMALDGASLLVTYKDGEKISEKKIDNVRE